MKILDFLHSRTFVTHLTGLAGILGAGAIVPTHPAVTLAIAALTGITQASHAYQAVKTKDAVSVEDIKRAVDGLV